MRKFILSIAIILVVLLNFPLSIGDMKEVYGLEELENINNLNVSSKSALLYDAKSGTVVFEKNSNQRLPIASMTKLASLKIVFEAIEKGVLSEDALIKVSKHAADTEGSSAFLDEKSEYKVSDLVMTVIVASANDSTVALAEAVAGSEDEFVKEMNLMVKNMGLENTNFINCTGLPAIDHYSSAYDISKIYSAICDNKLYKKYSKIWMTELIHPSGRKTEIVNTNRLIKTYEGCDSGKTGFTNDAGFCLSASATRGGMRLIAVVIGAKDSKTRFNEVANLFNFGFKNYENKIVISKEQPIYEVDISNSLKKSIKAYPEADFIKFLRKGEDFVYKVDYKIDKSKAPIDAGDKIGRIYIIDENNIIVHEEDLVIKEDVKAITIKDILKKIYQQI